MRRVLTLVLAIGLSGLGLQLAAQQGHQRPSDQQPSSQQPSDQRNSQQQTDATSLPRLSRGRSQDRAAN